MTAHIQLRRVAGNAPAPGTRRCLRWAVRAALPAAVAATLLGCGRAPLPAAVEGTLRLNGKPLDNCLVVFFPEPEKDKPGKPCSMGLTGKDGKFRLRCEDQRDGASPGWHRVTVQDMSASTGVRRRDHGAIDEGPDAAAPLPARPSRTRKIYLSERETPLRVEVKPGRQTIDIDIE